MISSQFSRNCRQLSGLVQGFGKETNLKAIYVSRKIDVVSLYKQKKIGRLVDDECLIVSLSSNGHDQITKQLSLDTASASVTTTTLPTSPPRQRHIAQLTTDMKELEKDRHCVYFSYGAIVFFNCDEKTQNECVEASRTFQKSQIAQIQSEDFLLEIDPSLPVESTGKFERDRLILNSLDLKSVSVVSSVLGHAVALNHYEEVVYQLSERFEDSDATAALHTLGESNKLVQDLILKLGLLDHAGESSAAAWQEYRYHRIWKGLREEFEIERRWRVLQTKTSFLQDSSRFQIEMKLARHGERVENAIVILISCELIIGIIHLARDFM